MHFSYPFTKGMFMAYIGYLMQRGLAAESINTYLSGIKHGHSNLAKTGG